MRIRIAASILLLFTAVFPVVVAGGCSAVASYLLYQWIDDQFSKDQQEPAISRISADKEEIHAGDTVLLEVEAKDNQDSQSELEFFWVATAGTLVNPTERITVWRAPDDPGKVSISVIVTDTDGNKDTATVELEVLE